MTEVIAYLIEHFQDFDNCPPPEDLGRLLEDAGFDVTEIGNTLMMMEVLFNTSEFAAAPFDSHALRVYCNEEVENLPQEVIGLMQYLVVERLSIPKNGSRIGKFLEPQSAVCSRICATPVELCGIVRSATMNTFS